MENSSQKIFEILAGFAETDSDREVYLNALGQDNIQESFEERTDRLLRQLKQGDRSAALKAYLQLVSIADESIQEQLRQIVRERVYSSATEELLRTELLVHFKPPRLLETEDVKVLLSSCPDWFTENNITRARTIQEIVAQRAKEELFRELIIEALKELNSYSLLSNAAYALLEALKNPLCALDVLRLMPLLREQTSLQEVFKLILKAERQEIENDRELEQEDIEQKYPLTYTLVEKLIGTKAFGSVGSLVTMLLASSAEPKFVVYLVQKNMS